jgi:hypothetical protein
MDTSSGVWVTYTLVTSSPSATQYTQNLTNGTITFNAAKNPPLAGVDNVKITYTKPIDGYKDRILKCTIINLFGVGGENRVFMSGNPDYKSQDWFSGLYDPTYFSDLDYSIVGTEETAVVGYTKYTNYQMAVKRTSQTQGTVYKRKGSINSSGEVEFTLETGISGLGAIGKHTFANLIDEPLFLTTQGIYAISTFNILSENVMRNRSFFVDNRLIKEPNLENAIACEYKGLYMLFINSHVYVLDSKQIGSVENDDMDFVYECYYWDNVPAYTVLSHENDLYFGTEDGKLCKFNYDLNTLIYNDDGEPINAYWYTTNDDDDAPQLEKTVQRLGNSVTIKPFTRTSATVYYIADSKEKVELVHGKMNVFSFNDINFNQFTFNTIRSVKEIYFKKQIKKYKRLQFMVENKALNEPFGVFSIIKTYTKGNLAKK